jgi:dipeptidyl aminopeptidase/acylaminoacyl peptidase
MDQTETGKNPIRQLTRGDFTVLLGLDWSPDGKSIAFSHAPIEETGFVGGEARYLCDISILDLSSGHRKILVDSNASEFRPIFSPDGKWLAYSATEDPPNRAHSQDLIRINIKTGEKIGFHHSFDRLVDYFASLWKPLGWSADGQEFFIMECRGTISRISALPVSGSPPRDIDLGDRLIWPACLNRHKTYFGFVGQTSSKPEEVFLTPVNNFNPQKISHLHQDLPDWPLGETRVVSWESIDGTTIEGLLSLPVGYESGRKYPLILIVHGGPAAAHLQQYTAASSMGNNLMVSAFTSKGYLVFRPNPRGSAGYGPRFRFDLISRMGDLDYQDVMAGIHFLIKEGIADPTKMGVIGVSYGGYLTGCIISKTNRFKAAVIICGDSDLLSSYGTSDIPGMISGYMGYEPWENYLGYLEASPVYYVSKIETPVLIQHGEKDERVHVTQAKEFSTYLKRFGRVPVRLVIYPNMGHRITDPGRNILIVNNSLTWFAKYVK